MTVKNLWTAITITTALIFAAQPGYASSQPQGVCVKEGLSAVCDRATPVKSPNPLQMKQYKTTKHRGKNIDPITTCSMSKKTPCTPKRPTR
jgi:hypothetical protein